MNTTTEPPEIYSRMVKVMRHVSAVRKNDHNDFQNFNFRGIDAVMNAVGPALREHEVVVVPRLVQSVYEDVKTSNNKPSTACRVHMQYVFYAPDGSSLEVSVPGEAWDSGDKACPKAMSVAFRTALLQALCLPTDEPDPDATTYERADDSKHVEAANEALDEWAQQAPEFYAAEVEPKRDKLVEYASQGPDYLDTVVSRLVREQEAWQGADA